LFIALTLAFNEQVTFETLLIRSTATLAVLLLHVILAIGPLCRLNKKFLPLLYNRRHLGVTMFSIALIHGTFSILQFHALGNTNPVLFIIYVQYEFRIAACLSVPVIRIFCTGYFFPDGNNES
jgi:DMSO/TMAO reductase YedYZ heme-binding membrane subunit